MKVVFLFSGQGSQYKGMGQKLFERNTVFRKSLEKSDAIIGKLLQRSLIRELYAKEQMQFDDLLITHPAIVAVEIAMYQVMQHMNIVPHFVSGNSLGEFAAGVVNGIWSEEDAIEASIEQAKSIVRTDMAGGMLAVNSQKEQFVQECYQRHNLYLASNNFEGHITLAGFIDNLNSFEKELQQADVQFLRLPVTFPFHSPLLQIGRYGFNLYMYSRLPLSKPEPGFISGIESKELSFLPEDYFWDVVSKYSNFPKTVNYLEKQGPCFYIDLGPSGTSATFVKYNLKPMSSSKTFKIMSPFRNEEEQLRALQKLMNS